MSVVNHKDWGIGQVVKREVRIGNDFSEVEYGGNYITVDFDNGKHVRFAIPLSFEKGIIEPIGNFADEVADVTAELELIRLAGTPDWGLTDGTRDLHPTETRTTKSPAKITLTGSMKEDFKTYLAESGYEPTVVYAYPRAVGLVCREEHLGWKALLNRISNIIPVYSKDGAKQHIGDYQNKTVINALKRYRDFGITNPEALTLD